MVLKVNIFTIYLNNKRIFVEKWIKLTYYMSALKWEETMIITFVSFKNFYSFKNKIQMDFTVNDKVPQTNHFGTCGDNNRFSKVSATFGANASGKTNLIIGFEFLQTFIAQSFSYSEEGFSSFLPFKTIENQPSSFEVHFYIENVFYKYCIEINTERILSEILESRQNKRLITLYDRKYISSDSSYTLQAKNINLESSFIEKVRPNASVISTARQYNHPKLTKIRNHWNSIFFENSMDDWDLLQNVSDFYSKHNEYFQKTKEFLKKSDLGLIDVQIESKQKEDIRGNTKNIFYPYGVHKSKNETFTLPFHLESGGTRNLYNKLSFIFPSLQKGSTCFIDELENNLHPNILSSIINLFIDPETNPKGAQLICTTHANHLMNELSKYQIFIVEKNLECESDIYRLDEVEGVRSDDNLSKKYLAGSYGGVPDIDM